MQQRKAFLPVMDKIDMKLFTMTTTTTTQKLPLVVEALQVRRASSSCQILHFSVEVKKNKTRIPVCSSTLLHLLQDRRRVFENDKSNSWELQQRFLIIAGVTNRIRRKISTMMMKSTITTITTTNTRILSKNTLVLPTLTSNDLNLSWYLHLQQKQKRPTMTAKFFSFVQFFA